MRNESGFVSLGTFRLVPPAAARVALEVEMVPVPAPALLQGEWRALEAASDASYFLGWEWIGTWLAQLPPDIGRRLVRARRGGHTVGLAILCEGERRRGPIATRALFLHATGRPELDDLTIEYNGVLAARGLEAEVLQAMAFALSDDPAWEEIYLDGWRDAKLVDAFAMPGSKVVTESRRTCRFVDLAALRQPGADYIAGLGGKTRNQVKRTLREAQGLGKVAFTVARDADEALAYLADLQRLHEATWAARGKCGAFANPTFRAFHEALVARHFAGGSVHLARLAAGDRAIGYIYGFVHRGHVYAYQTGFDYGAASFSAWSPGLATHACAIEHHRDQGHDVYDLMAGDSRYKRDLANGEATMDWLIVQRPRLKLRVYDGVRAAWSQVQGWRRKASGGPTV